MDQHGDRPPPTPDASGQRRFTPFAGLSRSLIGLGTALALVGAVVMASPTAAATVSVPSWIDATGSRNVSDQLQAFIRNVPNYSTINFKSGGTYQLGRAIRIANKKGLTLAGNGATLKLTGGGNYWGSGLFVDQGSANITIRNLNIVGNHAAAGTKSTCCSREGQYGIGIHGASNTVIEGVNIQRVGGDCFNIRDWNGNRVLSNWVTIRGSSCRLTGRSGVVINGANHVRIENNVFDAIGYEVVGMEPNKAYQGSTDIVVRGNTIGSYSLTNLYRGVVLSACDAPWAGGSTIRDVTVTGNTVAGNRNGKGGEMMGLNVKVCGDRGYRANFVVTSNRANQSVIGPVMRFTKVRGVTVSGNVQPLVRGTLATFTGSSSVAFVP